MGKKAVSFEHSSVRNIVVVCLALVVITLSVYVQVGNHEFLSYDDDVYVTGNPHVASGITGKNIIWAFTSVGERTGNWHPVTWLSHMTDVQFYGMNPGGHHITNVVIHTLSSLFLLLLLFRFTGSLMQSAFVAAMFALHPMHVESVAWVAERKDVLSAFFWFLTLIFYCEYVSKLKPALFILSLFCFVLGLMSKPMLVTLPMIMLLMDFWPLNRYQPEEREQGHRLLKRVTTLVVEKIPFFAFSLLSGIVAIYAQHNVGATTSLYSLHFMLRMENALISYVKYIYKTLWPHDLAILYPMSKSFQLWQVIGSLIILFLVSVTVIRAGRRFPYLLVGWFWFLITLVPVIGLIQVGSQSMADRYSYIPSIGLFVMAAWGIADLARGFKYPKGILTLLAGAVIVASAVLTWQQLGYWRDNVSLYRHTLQVTTGNLTINYMLGKALAQKGDQDGAIRQFQEALKTNPYDTKTHGSLGIAFADKGDLDAAIRQFQEVLRINPDDTKSQTNLGKALALKRLKAQ